MTTIFEPAYAKLNLTLDVLDKRQDGYHNKEKNSHLFHFLSILDNETC